MKGKVQLPAPHPTGFAPSRDRPEPGNTPSKHETRREPLWPGLEEIEEEMRQPLNSAWLKVANREKRSETEVAERYDATQQRGSPTAGGFEQEAPVSRVFSLDSDLTKKRGNRPLSSFSGGWLMRVELAKLFLAQPQVMLLGRADQSP